MKEKEIKIWKQQSRLDPWTFLIPVHSPTFTSYILVKMYKFYLYTLQILNFHFQNMIRILNLMENTKKNILIDKFNMQRQYVKIIISYILCIFSEYNLNYIYIFFVYFFGGLECVGHSFAYVAHLWFLRDVWIRTQSTAVASWRATDLATHPSNYINISNFYIIITTKFSHVKLHCLD
jgi:hypothetical protein